MGIINTNTMKLLALLALLLFHSESYGYAIKGKIVDESNTPIRKALIIGRNKADKVRIGVETDQMGQFLSANVNDSTLLVEISKEDYSPVYINVVGTTDAYIDLGVVQLNKRAVNLDEVSVTAQSVIQKADRYIILPSAQELANSTDGLSLLNKLQFKMPGLEVIETLQSIKVDNVAPVLKINDKPSDLTHYLSLNPDNVLRIEYHDNPDIRYGNRQVINVILKPREDGGYVLGNLMSSVTTGNLNGNVGANYHNKKSEFDLIYRVNWRNYDNRLIDADERFIAPDYTIVRQSLGLSSSEFNYVTNEVAFDYTYTHNPKTMFAVKVGAAFEDRDMSDNSANTETTENGLTKFNRYINRRNFYSSPNIDLFFKKRIDDSQYIEINAFGRYSTGDYDRYNSDIFDGGAMERWFTKTENKFYNAGSEILYSKSVSKNFTANFGVKDNYNVVDNSQNNDAVLTTDKIKENHLSAYTQLYGRVSRLNYGFNLGYMHRHSDNNGYDVNASRFRANVNANYAFSQYVSVNYLFMYDPAMPSTSQQSELVQTIDGISVRQGNPDLKPTEYFRNRVYVRYANQKFSSSVWVSHSRTNNPIYYNYSYIDDASSPYYNKFMSKPINGQHNDLMNLEWNLSLSNLFGHLTLWGKAAWDFYRVDLFGKKYKKNYFYGSINGSFVWENWMLSFNYRIKPRYYLSGNTFSDSERWNTVGVQYRYKNWMFSVVGLNLFTKRGATYKSITYSDVHPVVSETCIKNNANMIMLGVNYRLDFGKKRNKEKRSLHNGGVERGVDIEY